MSVKKKRKKMGMIIGLLLVAAIAAGVIVLLPGFGRLPRGERRERVLNSPNYRDGQFRNLEPSPLMADGKGLVHSMLEFLFGKKEGLRPDHPITAVRTDLRSLAPDSDLVVWFGHSSYLVQTDGRRALVDPVFLSAAPLSFLNRPFKGADLYRPEDMPDIDYLVITHDHWDHLDHGTVKALMPRIRAVVCPLGVGEHFEYWGFPKERIVELDWHEQASLDDGFAVRCLPARHFSGRGLKSNQSLWGSFLLQAPSRKIYIGGDGGYGKHFAEIGREFPDIDLAVLENGQYNEAWRYIHILPGQLAQAAKDLGAKQVLTVHHSKYALARHRWDEPLKTEATLAADTTLHVLRAEIGEVVPLAAPQEADVPR